MFLANKKNVRRNGLESAAEVETNPTILRSILGKLGLVRIEAEAFRRAFKIHH